MYCLLSSLFLLLTLCFPSAPQQPAQPTDLSAASLTGPWIVTADYLGTFVNTTMELNQQGDKLTGHFQGDKLEGTVTGHSLRFLAKDDQGGSEQVSAQLQPNNTMTGTIIWTDGANPSHPATVAFTARRREPMPSSNPQMHEFVPTVFYRQFSPHNKPVLTLNPGDTVHTTTVDAGGVDEKGVPRSLGGNPQTGPFYVNSAQPGDTLVVHITRLRLNRDWALSDDFVVPRALDSSLAVKMKDGGKTIRWHLDLAQGMATPENPADHLKHYAVPVKPMLGCVAVSPGLATAPPATQDSGNWGGNMDFNEITEGSTVYLPVRVPGAFLYVGDGHALQGDGELNGNALETSMDVTFAIDLISGKSVPGPRVVTPTHIIAVGLDGSLDDAFRDATSNMADWLADDYKLSPSETAQVLGTAAEYKVSEAADRNAGIVLKLNKERLQSLQ